MRVLSETSVATDRSLSELFQKIVSRIAEICRSEVLLAKTEIQQELKKTAKAGSFYLVGAIFGIYTIGILLLGVVYALATVVAAWQAALIVGVGTAVLALILFLVGKSLMDRTDLKPRQTLQSLEDNLRWIKK